MRTAKLTRFVPRLVYVLTSAVVVFLITTVLSADPPADGRLKVLRTGLGSGSVTTSPGGITCGPVATCEATFPSSPEVVVTASPEPGSRFVGWDRDPHADPGTPPDCPDAANPCTLTMDRHRSLRPVFEPTPDIPTLASFTPEGIQAYLDANPTVNNAARFIRALPAEYKQNWILMTRSESLQTGTAKLPRILLPSANGESVFTIGMDEHSSYPAAHPDAIEYMQWDNTQKNFRFHEIVLATIPEMDADGDGIGVVEERGRRVSVDDEKCSKCHSTRNVAGLDRSFTPPRPSVGTDGLPPGSVQVKNKPNWDAYDSWGGMMAFNRDRIYKGSAEAAAFRKFFNPWTWREDDFVRSIVEQLALQPAGVPAAHVITRLRGGPNDGHIKFVFDDSSPVLTEPTPSSSGTGDEAPITTSYSFDRLEGTGAGSTVTRGGTFITLHHSTDVTGDEGRAVNFFDFLGGLGTASSNLNSKRVADELINHHHATGSVPIDVRPVALAIAKQCFNIDGTTVRSTPAHTGIDLAFFNSRNGMNAGELLSDTRARAESLPRRKADMQKLNLHRDGDVYVAGADPADGLIPQYTSTPTATPDTSLTRLRQEVFRRPTRPIAPDTCVGPTVLLCPDATALGAIYVDRELHRINAEQVALYRYFLEPLGVSVDKWSMGVRGRSRTYTFADVFGTFENTLIGVIESDLRPGPGAHPIPGLTAFECEDLIPHLDGTLAAGALPDPEAIPRYTDVQRIFNKNCIECHGGLDYPPYQNYGTRLDLSENEKPPAGEDRLDRPHDNATRGFLGPDPDGSFIYNRITDYGDLTHPYDPLAANEDCPRGLMPCAGPPLSKTDIETIRRWIVGGSLNSRGDTHIQTIDGVSYDFQSAGEFVLLRGPGLEIQARQAAVETARPLDPDRHTGIVSCPSVNSAVAIRVGRHRITYQPNLNGEPDPQGLQLRVDGQLSKVNAEGILLETGGRILPTTAQGGIQIEVPGGTVVVVTPGFWNHYQLWYLDISVRSARATDGVMGAIAHGSWLPALPDGSSLGPRPRDLHQRYVDLYDKFENAWRVNDGNTLFDYAPGTSTATFTVAGWPIEDPQTCTVPARTPGGPLAKPPAKALPLDVAQQHCRPLVSDAARANCAQDVMATGDPDFAQTYLRAEQIQRNAAPPAPGLVSPERFKTDLPTDVTFTWNGTSDADGDPLTYRHCVWPVKEEFSFGRCVITSVASVPAPRWRVAILWALLVILLLCLLLLTLLIFKGMKKRPALVALLVIVIVASAVLAFYVGRTGPTSGPLAKTVSGLRSGEAYYWKVLVEDGKGRTVESEMRRFEIK